MTLAVVNVRHDEMRRYREHGTGALVRAWQATGPCQVAVSTPGVETPLTMRADDGDWVILRSPGHLTLLAHRTFVAIYQEVA